MPLSSVSNLPLATETPAATNDLEISSSEMLNLLVIDDEEGPRQSLRMVFRREFNVTTVDSGAAALEFMQENEVHLAILDIRMVDCSGIDVLRKIKQADPRIEVIMLTAYETLETARQALRLGACDYLSKPFELSTIREAVSRALHLRRISQNIASTSNQLRELTNRLGDSSLREEVARTRNEIYAGVLHDINNPLTVITGFVDLLQIRLGNVTAVSGEDLDTVRYDLATISKQVTACGAIAERYLRIINQTDRVHSKVSVNQTLDDVQTLLRHNHNGHSSKLAVKPLEPDHILDLDATDLVQILINLTNNAFQSTSREQTVWLIAERIEAPQPTTDEANIFTVGAESFKPDGLVTAITVLDEGDGILPEKLDHIFDAYYTTKESLGTGLGLSIVSRLVKTNRGLLTVKSEVGEGTSVTLYFA